MRISDWSSDVCSSDLEYNVQEQARVAPVAQRPDHAVAVEHELEACARPRTGRAQKLGVLRWGGTRTLQRQGGPRGPPPKTFVSEAYGDAVGHRVRAEVAGVPGAAARQPQTPGDN